MTIDVGVGVGKSVGVELGGGEREGCGEAVGAGDPQASITTSSNAMSPSKFEPVRDQKRTRRAKGALRENAARRQSTPWSLLLVHCISQVAAPESELFVVVSNRSSPIPGPFILYQKDTAPTPMDPARSRYSMTNGPP